MTEAQRLKTWIEWYRFATRTLRLSHDESAAYATARYVEEQNRQVLREGRAA